MKQTEYERAMIGCALLDPEHLVDGERIPESFFTDKECRKIWNTMLALRAAGGIICLVSVFDALQGDGKDNIAQVLADISSIVSSSANAEFYIEKLAASATKQEIARISMRLNDSIKAGKDTDGILADLEQGLLNLRKRTNTSVTVRPREALEEIIRKAEERIKAGASGPIGIASGFARLDVMTGGFQQGDFILIAARTSIGKSALALSFIEKQVELGVNVALASLEMSAVQVWQRLIAMKSFVSAGKLRFGHLDQEDMKRLIDAASEFFETGLLINDRVDLTTAALRSWAAQMVEEGCKILYVDYVGLLRGSEGRTPRWEQMAEVSRALKSIARELKIPVVALVQLNREAADKREPGLHNLRDSGAFEQDADIVMLLTRSEKEKTDDVVPARLLLKKQRSGPTGKIDLEFRRSLTRFREADEFEEYEQPVVNGKMAAAGPG